MKTNKLIAYVVIFVNEFCDYSTFKLFRNRWSAEKYLSELGWYEDESGLCWYHPNRLKNIKAKIEKCKY